MPTRRRLDSELVRRGMADSRASAQRMIDSGGVLVAGRPSARPATLVAPGEPIEIVTDPGWASRAGGKLEGALDHFQIDPTGRRALDVGASTGGFTDVLLSRGARSVLAVDVGYGQMISRLATDPRVEVLDRTNFRNLDVAAHGAPFDLIVVDVSFIAVGLIATKLAEAGQPGADYVVLVKPQFEVGRDSVGRGGIVRDVELHHRAITTVADALGSLEVAPQGVIASPVIGTHGNQEFLLHCRLGAPSVSNDVLLAGLDT